MSERADVVVIGAGVVGLAVARAFARRGRDVIIVEKHSAIGTQTSSRNSEVIHAGIQYRPSGLRARLAVDGRDRLYTYCKDRGVNFARCGKLLVARALDQCARLDALKANAEQNGVTDLRIISRKEAQELEPALACAGAIVSPSSGIIDSHGLMLALLGDLENARGVLALNAPVIGGRVHESGARLEIGGADPVTLEARLAVNCAGLYADKTARALHGLAGNKIPNLKYGKGQYFTYSGKAPFERLIYPLPAPDTQGVHYTRDLGGQAKLGPDLSYVEGPDDYGVDETRRAAFAAEARRFWPGINEDKLTPGYAGIRPKIAGPNAEGDFVILGPETYGAPGYIGLYGIESPGLTTCLAIAEYVVKLSP